MSAGTLTPLQVEMRDRVVALLEAAGVEPSVKEKREERPEGDPFEVGPAPAAGAVERVVVVRFEVGRARFEVWAYADAAGVVEPGDDWWPFDAEDFDTRGALVEAVCAHVRDVLEEHDRRG